jgi:tRNA-dihydrouridine synthase B
MRIGNLNLSGRVLLAPLAGVSNRPFRVLAIRSGAAMTFTEMVSSEGIIRRQAKTMAMMAFKADERPLGVQLFGANPDSMYEASRIVAQEVRPDALDINLGCPVKKVVNKNGGAALLKNLPLTESIMKAVVAGAGGVPVMIKLRSGWDDAAPVYVEVGHAAENSGVAAITLHARSRAGGFSGRADWSAIKRLKDSVSIPVIGNGDVVTPEDAGRMIEETGCDGVMIGRAALGNPFIFERINRYLQDGELVDRPSRRQSIEMARLHCRLMVEEFGEKKGALLMRKYLAWYVKGFPGASELRTQLFSVSSSADVDRILAEYLNETVPDESTDNRSLSSERTD